MTNETKFAVGAVPATLAAVGLYSQPFGLPAPFEAGLTFVLACILGVGGGLAVRAVIDERYLRARRG